MHQLRRFLSLLMLVPALAWADNNITLVSDPYPPYILDSASGKGFVTDIAIAAFKLKGYKAVYQNVPFKRAIKGVEEGKYDAVLAIGKGARENFVYPEETLGQFKNAFFIGKNHNWAWTGNIQDLNQVTLGFINGYEFGSGTGFMDYINKNKSNPKRIQIVSGSTALEKNIKKLVSGRIDAFIDDELVVWYTANKLQLTNSIKNAGTFEKKEPEYVSLGFSAKNPKAKEYTQALDEGIRELKKNGELKKILTQYGITSLN